MEQRFSASYGTFQTLALFHCLNISSQAHKANWQQNWFYITVAILYELELQKIVSDNSTHSNLLLFSVGSFGKC